MDFDWTMALGSFLVAVIVGLTGMGGGALMTPMLVTFFGVSPLAAVSSDLVAAAVMKPVGSAVHYRQGTINMRLVAWCAGRCPPRSPASCWRRRSATAAASRTSSASRWASC